jgi:hypothetical protein
MTMISTLRLRLPGTPSLLVAESGFVVPVLSVVMALFSVWQFLVIPY